MKEELNDTDIKNLRELPKFVGMNIQEIQDWLAIDFRREYNEWNQEFQTKLTLERADDAAYLRKPQLFDKVDPSGPSVHIEECVRIDLGPCKKIYLKKEIIRRCLVSRRNNCDWMS